MKLLYWMQRKLKQNTTSEQFKDFVIAGQACNCLSGLQSPDEQQYKCSLRVSKSQKQNLLLHSSCSGQAEFEEYYSVCTESGHLSGLLTIGTLDSDNVTTESETPRFSVNVWDKEEGIREDELRELNEELFSCEESIGNGSGVLCPNEEDSFGSPIWLADAPSSTCVKKENRTSLGDLFQMSKVEEVLAETEQHVKGEKEGEKSVKKKHKKKALGSSAVDSSYAENKRNKVLQMFQRKVHPEGLSAMKKSNKNENKNNEDIGHDIQLPDEDTITYHRISVSKERIRRLKSDSPHFAIGVNDSNGTREYWIKTDAEYVVLEL